MNRKIAPGLLICGLGLSGLAGCVGTSVQPMDAGLFAAPSLQENPPVDRPAAEMAADQQPMSGGAADSTKAPSILPTAKPPLDSIAPLDAIQPGPTTAPTNPIPAAAVLPAPISPVIDPPSAVDPTHISAPSGQGVYMTLGGVLAQVNNTPIYANEVLSRLNKQFAAKARELDSVSFRRFAESGIRLQLNEEIQDERIFANAYQELNDDDRKLADSIAMQVRHERVIAAGGSVAEAKRRAADDGLNFDEAMTQEYRKIVQAIYQRRQIEPRIQVTADNMREFYSRNVEKMYSDKDRAQFRVIEVDPAKIPGANAKQVAMDKVRAIRERALHGDDFATLASTLNDDDFLRGRGGNPCDPGGWMERNTYRIDAVEAAVWALEPGQITPVIECDKAFYIARLDAKHVGMIRPFDDEKVQQDIYDQLYRQQFGDLMERFKEMSFNDAMVNTDEKRMQMAVDMAMQKYAQWSSR